jgi:opacity protein-like surface antigen
MKKMKKIVFTVSLVLSLSFAHAQDSEKELIEKTSKAASRVDDAIPNGWKKTGAISFLFNQSAFNNEWKSGGTSSYAGNLSINYDFNYKKDSWVCDNKIFGSYGVTQIKGADKPTKTDDRLEFTSLLGKKASGYWYYSAFLNFKTQFDSGFDAKSGTRTSHFFSPAYLQIGPGMLWKKSDNLKVNIAPATSRLIIVDGQFTELGSSFGVEQGKTTRFEFGAALNAYYKLQLMENISMENILNLYSNYLDKPGNVDVDYQMNLVMKVNKYISANLSLQTIYDDNAIKAVQVKEVFGLGVNYGF